MAAPGLVTNKLTLFIDGDNVTPEVSRAEVLVGDSDSDFVSFADAAAGGNKEFRLALTFVQGEALFDLVWNNAGQEFPVEVRPMGNATPGPGKQAHYEGTVTISWPDGTLIGGEADPSSTARFTNEVEWVFLEKPTRVTA